MTTVEVLAPLRIETRFLSPADRTDGGAGWLLRLRVYPDEFSVRPVVPPPAPDELDRLGEAVAAMAAPPGPPPPGKLGERDAFAAFASAVGPARALYLWRLCVTTSAAGIVQVDRSREEPRGPQQVHAPTGLPERLQVWFVHSDGTRTLAATLALDPVAIGGDLDLDRLAGDVTAGAGAWVPDRWWSSYQRAKDVGLGADIDLGETPPVLDALVVAGLGDTDAADLVDAQVRAGRLAVLRQGTPTNTVEGEPTTDLGGDAETLYPLLHLDPTTQQGTRDVLTALTGRLPADAVPLLGGDVDQYAPQSIAVQAFWPVLWGRMLRDVADAGERETALARWAIRSLAVEGPRPAIRVGDQPYGLLPTTLFATWADDGREDAGEQGFSDAEGLILRWALPWRAGAAAAARLSNGWVKDADTGQLLAVLGLHAPNRRHRLRPIADLVVLQAIRAMRGLPGMPATAWDRFTAEAMRDVPYPAHAIGAGSRSGPLPGPPHDANDDAQRLRDLCLLDGEPLYFQGLAPLGLVGHLVREALIVARASVGEAVLRIDAGTPVELGAPLPLDDEGWFVRYVIAGRDEAVDRLEASGDPNALTVARRFRDVREGIQVLADLWDTRREPLFRATLAALDAATFRVDPWLTGIAHRRLSHMAADGAPFRAGAYGWVDAPAPYGAGDPAALAPGPSTAGLLHAPSHAQALTAALLRDAAVRYPGDDQWNLTIDSAKVRTAAALAERVRLGVHPHEALGLEVEKLAGDWDVVRVLRQTYPLDADQQERRVCDGAAVLDAARRGALPAGLPATLAATLAPLDNVLDTYADLLVADGAFALATGRGDLAAPAMEAAAGLGPPPQLRALHTPREATTVAVAAWAVLPAGTTNGADPPARLADPAFADLTAAADPAGQARLAALLGGGETDPPVPALTGGTFEGLGAGADTALTAAAEQDLTGRLATLTAAAQSARDDLAARDVADPGLGDAVTAASAAWAVDLSGVVASDPAAFLADPPTPATAGDRRDALVAALTGRLTPAPPTGQAGAHVLPLNHTRQQIRALVGRPWLPVLPQVDVGLLPVLRPVPSLDRDWLEVTAAVHPRLAALEAHQLTSADGGWPAAIAAPDGSTDPWHAQGPVLLAYGPGVTTAAGRAAGTTVALTALDAWSDSIPSRRHTTAAAFGFNAPKSRPPQAILLAVPPDRSTRLTADGLLDVVLETRELVHARGTQRTDRGGLPYATPMPIVHADTPASFARGWPA
jgi:hypothetical protein